MNFAGLCGFKYVYLIEIIPLLYSFIYSLVICSYNCLLFLMQIIYAVKYSKFNYLQTVLFDP